MCGDWGILPEPLHGSARKPNEENAHHPVTDRRDGSRRMGARPHLPLRQRIHQQRPAGQGPRLQAGWGRQRHRGPGHPTCRRRNGSASGGNRGWSGHSSRRISPVCTPCRHQRPEGPRCRCPCHPRIRVAQGRGAPCRAGEGIQRWRAGAQRARPAQPAALHGAHGRTQGQRRPQRKRYRRHQARNRPSSGQLNLFPSFGTRVSSSPFTEAPASDTGRFHSLDLMSTLVAVLRADGAVQFANAALENALGLSRRTLEGVDFSTFFTDPALLQTALAGARGKDFAALRYEASLKRQHQDPVPVHVSVADAEQVGEILVELWPLEQQARQDREERLLDQAQANKELIRNLAHEIKNPLGGIRGAAQLLEMELESRELTEYTQVIIHEADRLQSLVDLLLAPHRHPHLVGDVNIHEVCERVRSLVLVEYPQGLKVLRDYDTSIPEFRGDRAQLIQALLNIVQNAAQALTERIAEGEATITLRTRVARQVTFGRQRYRLALELHVIDNGPGVPDAIKERIFYPLVSGRDGGS